MMTKNSDLKIEVLENPVDNHIWSMLVVYRSEEGPWNAFAFPYDVTTQAKSESAALSQLKELVDDYEDALESHGRPEHLCHRFLSRLEDRKMFDQILREGRAINVAA